NDDAHFRQFRRRPSVGPRTVRVRVSSSSRRIDAKRATLVRADRLMGDWFPKQTLGSLPERAAVRWGAREARYFKGRRWSFAELSAGGGRLGGRPHRRRGW